MKRITKKQRLIDVKRNIFLRKKRVKKSSNPRENDKNSDWRSFNKWFDDKENIEVNQRKIMTLYLPDRLNFSNNYESTVSTISIIRKFSDIRNLSYKSYRLGFVNFDRLNQISTSAALVLTAELSKWDDTSKRRLRPLIKNWNPEILRGFNELGFFDLFNCKEYWRSSGSIKSEGNLKLVRYIKGKCGDSRKTRILREKITEIVGENVDKWTFLRCGLDEAITNVTHHAYPDRFNFRERDKNWYLTGSFDSSTKELKIVFYDQGIGIPRSLPASDVWERVLESLSNFSIVERKKDEVLLKAAVELDRSSTLESDRGKGLQDLLEFIRQRQNGYLSILSLKGLYKYSVKNGNATTKTEHFNYSICGTLIIWSVYLNK